jgi:hypothetical protein
MNEEETSKALLSDSVLRREGSLASAALNEVVDFGRSRADELVGWYRGFWGLGKWRLTATRWRPSADAVLSDGIA